MPSIIHMNRVVWYKIVIKNIWQFIFMVFATYWDMQHIRGSTRMRYTNLFLLTYLLTYWSTIPAASFLTRCSFWMVPVGAPWSTVVDSVARMQARRCLRHWSLCHFLAVGFGPTLPNSTTFQQQPRDLGWVPLSCTCEIFCVPQIYSSETTSWSF